MYVLKLKKLNLYKVHYFIKHDTLRDMLLYMLLENLGNFTKNQMNTAEQQQTNATKTFQYKNIFLCILPFKSKLYIFDYFQLTRAKIVFREQFARLVRQR